MKPPMFRDLFRAHIAKATGDVQEVLSKNGYSAMLSYAGTPHFYHADDQEVPFRSNAHFARFTPVSGPHHLLIVTTKDPLPFLIEVRPQDFWEEQHDSSNQFWRDVFPVETVVNSDEAWGLAKKHIAPESAVMVGDEQALEKAKTHGISDAHSEVIAELDILRSIKTPYEVACIDEANKCAAEGHKKAVALFESGASEHEIYLAYLDGTKTTECELPYAPIVALNEKAATLHYQRRRKDPRNGTVLLLDAGVSINGYASDITRTTVRENVHPIFENLCKDLDTLQRELVAAAVPGAHFIELHHQAHIGIAIILKRQGILSTDPETAIEKELTHAFFPHGLGHMLGLQVHDVGNASHEGLSHKLREKYPRVRTNMQLRAGNVTTIEPGIYFIEMLLEPQRTGENKKVFNWQLIDELLPCGGIRIEDNIVVREEDSENLTRKYLP